MQTSLIGNPHRTWTDVLHDGMQTSKNMTLKSNTFLETLTYLQMPYHVHLEWIKAKTTIRKSRWFLHPIFEPSSPWKNQLRDSYNLLWHTLTTTWQPDIRAETKQSGKQNNFTNGQQWMTGSLIISKDVLSVNKTKLSLTERKPHSTELRFLRTPDPSNK